MPTPITIDKITEDYERLRRQKSRHYAGVEGRILQNLAFLAGEQYVFHARGQLVAENLDANKLHLTFNLTEQMMRKVIGRLLSIAGIYKAKPDRHDPKSMAMSEVVDKLDKALDEKLGQPTRSWELLWWMAVGGVGFVYTPWVPDSTMEPMPRFDEATGELMWLNNFNGEELPDSAKNQMVEAGLFPPEMFSPKEELRLTGDVGCEVLSPLQVFVDNHIRSLDELPPDSAVYIAKIKTIGWIEENYPDIDADALAQLRSQKEVKIITTAFRQIGNSSVANTYLSDMVARIQGSRDANDPDMAVIVERYQGIGKEYPQGRYTVFAPGIAVLRDEDNPYEEIPVVDLHWQPTAMNFWNKDFVTDLTPAQRFLNKRMSQLGEQANAAIYAHALLGPGLAPDDIPADYAAPIERGLSDQGVPMVQHKEPPQLPAWFMQSIDLTIKLLKELAGGVDLFQQERFPGQLRGPLAVPMLQEILDTEWGPLYEHIGERMARVKQQRINRVKQFYPAYRTLHYTGNDMQDEVFVFHTEEVLRSGVEYRITVERGSLLPELRALREARVRERLNSPLAILYTDERTNTLDKSKIAKDLQYGDLGRDAAESQYRKLAIELIDRVKRGEQIPEAIPLPFWKHEPMMDELESAMATTEFLAMSSQVQQQLMQMWERHRSFLQQAAQAQQAGMENQMIQSAVAQATQQAAAKAAAEAVESALLQMNAQGQASFQNPPAEQLATAMQQG